MGIFDRLFGKEKKIKISNIDKLKKKRDVAGLIKAVQYADTEVRHEAISALGEIGPEARDAVPALVQALKDIDVPGAQNYGELNVWVGSVSDESIHALRKIGIVPVEAISILMSNLKQMDTMVRKEACENLGRIYKNAPESHKPNIVSALIGALNDEHGYVRQAAALGLKFALFGLKPVDPIIKRAIPALIEAFKDEEDYVRKDAASAVSEFDVEAVPALLKALKDDNPEVYGTAAWVIGVEIADSGRRMDEKLHKALIPAIQYLIDIVDRTKISKGASSYDKYVARAIGTLGDIGDSSAIPVLEKILTKVQKKVEKEGMVREYVDTGIAAGYISPKDDIYNIETAINAIKEREKKMQ